MAMDTLGLLETILLFQLLPLQVAAAAVHLVLPLEITQLPQPERAVMAVLVAVAVAVLDLAARLAAAIRLALLHLKEIMEALALQAQIMVAQAAVAVAVLVELVQMGLLALPVREEMAVHLVRHHFLDHLLRTLVAVVVVCIQLPQAPLAVLVEEHQLLPIKVAAVMAAVAQAATERLGPLTQVAAAGAAVVMLSPDQTAVPELLFCR